jgi:mannose-6-phosphate isomerase-like protein (cupin superfamily)
MIVRNSLYTIISDNSNTNYWEKGELPEWTALNTFRLFTGKSGQGAEPHYHDCDEIWLFTAGVGEVWLDGHSFPITPNTAVYTPMGVVHRFQMFTDYEVTAQITHLEGKQRGTHILVEEEGPPTTYSVPGFVVPGAGNVGPFPDRGSRCPLSELRLLTFAAGDELGSTRLPVHEHLMVLAGSAELTVEGLAVTLATGDVAALREGAMRHLQTQNGARVALAREPGRSS